MREVFRMVESDLVYVVPVFISEGYFTQKVIPRELGLGELLTRSAAVRSTIAIPWEAT